MTARGSRLRLVLALQGCAAVLYVLAQAGRLVPTETWAVVRPLDALVTGGNVAVAMMLALAGFSLATRVLEARPRGPLPALRRGAGDLGLVVAAVALVCAGAVVVDATDDTDGADWSTTSRSVLRVLSFGWNLWLRDNPGSGRADLTSLWFFSVLVQLMLVVLVLVAVLGRRPIALAAVLGAAAVACAVERVVVLDQEGWFAVSLGTVTRGDAFFLGAAAAALSMRFRSSPGTAAAVLGGSSLVLVGTVLAASMLTVEETFRVLVPTVAVLAALAALAAVQVPDPRTLAVDLLGRDAVAVLGRHWYLLVAWSPFVAVTVGRRLVDQPTGLAAVVSVLATVALVAGSAWLLGQVAGRAGTAWSAADVGRRRLTAEVGSDDRRPGGQPPADG